MMSLCINLTDVPSTSSSFPTFSSESCLYRSQSLLSIDFLIRFGLPNFSVSFVSISSSFFFSSACSGSGTFFLNEIAAFSSATAVFFHFSLFVIVFSRFPLLFLLLFRYYWHFEVLHCLARTFDSTFGRYRVQIGFPD